MSEFQEILKRKYFKRLHYSEIRTGRIVTGYKIISNEGHDIGQVNCAPQVEKWDSKNYWAEHIVENYNRNANYAHLGLHGTARALDDGVDCIIRADSKLAEEIKNYF